MTTTRQAPETGRELTIRERRKRLGINGREAAKRAGITHATLVKMEQETDAGADLAAIKTTSVSRRKVLGMLEREEQERKRLAAQLLEEGMRNGKLITRDVTNRIKAGEMSEAAGMIASATLMATYAEQLADLDPDAASLAESYLEAVRRNMVGTPGEEN